MVAPRDLRQTHTFVIMDLSPRAYEEIRRNMKEAGYDHVFIEEDGRVLIDMAGIAVGTWPDKLHPSHKTRYSDASTFDEICTVCGATDIAGGGWGSLAKPCPGAENEDTSQATTGPQAEAGTDEVP